MEMSRSMIRLPLVQKSLLGGDQKNHGDHNSICRSGGGGNKKNSRIGTYLYKDNTTNSFQDQHNCHRQCIDASIVMHVRVIFHTVAYDSIISQSHSGVLQKIQGFSE